MMFNRNPDDAKIATKKPHNYNIRITNPDRHPERQQPEDWWHRDHIKRIDVAPTGYTHDGVHTWDGGRVQQHIRARVSDRRW